MLCTPSDILSTQRERCEVRGSWMAGEWFNVILEGVWEAWELRDMIAVQCLLLLFLLLLLLCFGGLKTLS